MIKGNTIPGLKGRYTQMDHNILLEQVNRLITEPLRQSSVEFYDSTTIAKRLEGKIPYSILVKVQMELAFFR